MQQLVSLTIPLSFFCNKPWDFDVVVLFRSPPTPHFMLINYYNDLLGELSTKLKFSCVSTLDE